MAIKVIPGGWEDFGDTVRVFAVIPTRPDGSVNVSVMNAALLALTRINASAFDPDPLPAVQIAHADGHTADGGGVMPEAVAKALLRDKTRDDDEGERIPGYPPVCKTGGCDD